MTLDKLKTNTRKELAALAKRHHVAGWHGMRKEELIEALVDVQRAKMAERNPGQDRLKPVDRGKATDAAPSRPASSRPAPDRPAPSRPAASRPLETPRSVARVKPQSPASALSAGRGGTPLAAPEEPCGRPSGGSLRVSSSTGRVVRKDISTAAAQEHLAEELTAVAHDPYWIHARWVLRRTTVQRAEAALGADWFRAVPIIRVHALDVDDVKGVQAQWVRDVEIHGESDHWFVPVENPPGTFKLQIGYLSSNGRFFALAKSRRVATPRPGSKAAERLGWNRNGSTGTNGHRPPTRPGSDPQFEKFLAARAVSYAVSGTDHRIRPVMDVPFTLETELIVSGTADPQAHLTIQGETIRVGRDGRFTLRVPLVDGRLVVPAVSVTHDGACQRTIVLAIDRNVKELELQTFEELT